MPQKSRASLRNRDAHGRHKKTSHARIYRNWCTWGCHKNAILCEDLKEKCRAQKLAATFPASLRNRNAHGHVTRAICLEIYRKNARGHLWRHGFARAFAVEIRMDMSQEPFCVDIYRENAGRVGYHLD